MLARIVEASLRYKFLVLTGALLLVALGIRALTLIPIDAFPDVTPVQVQIFTESVGLSPEEVEKIITVPVESAMAGLPKVELIRSLSMYLDRPVRSMLLFDAMARAVTPGRGRHALRHLKRGGR